MDGARPVGVNPDFRTSGLNVELEKEGGKAEEEVWKRRVVG